MEWLGAGLGWLGSTIANFVGANQSRISNERAASKNAALQKQFAKHGIRWKVEDAKRAGIHPLAALGASTHSPSPVHVGDTSVGNAFAQSGQDLTRAISTTSTGNERALQKLQLATAKANLDGQLLENQFKASQLQKLNSTGPGMPGSDNFIPGQGNSPLVDVKPLERTVSQPGRVAQQAGWYPSAGYMRTDTGLAPVIPSELSEPLESDPIGALMWRWRNSIVPNWDRTERPPRSQLPSGYKDWDWNVGKQEWQPVKYRAPNEAPWWTETKKAPGRFNQWFKRKTGKPIW